MLVDIQESFSGNFNREYLTMVYDYLVSTHYMYDRIVTLLEPDLTMPDNHFLSMCEPCVRYPLFLNEFMTDSPLIKMYSDWYTYSIIAGYYSPTLDLDTDYYDFTNYLIENPDKLVAIGNLGYAVSLTNTENMQALPYTLYISPIMDNYLRSLPDGTEVDFVGGGLDECVYITYLLLKTYNLQPNTLAVLCYEMHGGTTLCRDVEYCTVGIGDFNEYKVVVN